MDSELDYVSKIIPTEEFKELCLNYENLKEKQALNEILNELFDPDNKLNRINYTQLLDYITAGLPLNDFKAKCK